jgi:hypothetical protein
VLQLRFRRRLLRRRPRRRDHASAALTAVSTTGFGSAGDALNRTAGAAALRYISRIRREHGLRDAQQFVALVQRRLVEDAIEQTPQQAPDERAGLDPQ